MITIKRNDPRIRIASISATVLATVLLSKISPIIVVLGSVTIVALLYKKLSKALSYLSFFKIVLPILFVVNLFFYAEGKPLAGADLILFELAITGDGLQKSIFICLRLFTVALAAALLVVSMSPEEFEYGLKKLGFPWKVAFIFSLSLKLVPEMKRKYEKIDEAQRARGVKTGGNPFKRAKRKIPILIPFLASVSRYGFELSEVLKARNFSSKRTCLMDLEYEN